MESKKSAALNSASQQYKTYRIRYTKFPLSTLLYAGYNVMLKIKYLISTHF